MLRSITLSFVAACSLVAFSHTTTAAVIGLDGDGRLGLDNSAHGSGQMFFGDDLTLPDTQFSGTGSFVREYIASSATSRQFIVFWEFTLDATFAADLNAQGGVRLDYDIDLINNAPAGQIWQIDSVTDYGANEAASITVLGIDTSLQAGDLGTTVGANSLTFDPNVISSAPLSWSANDRILLAFIAIDNGGVQGAFSVDSRTDVPTLTSVVIPEPASLALLGLGGLCLFGRRSASTHI